jgi:HK97 family phage portal protein
VKLFDWFRPKNYTLADPEFATTFSTGMTTGTGVVVTPDNALRISAVYGCVRILSETVASLPLKIYRETSKGRELASHPLNDLLGVSGNGEQTAMEQREFQMSSLGLRGNSYSLVSRSFTGRVGQISGLKPAYVNMTRDASGKLVCDYQEPGNNGVYSADRIWRVAALGCDGVTGLSPIALARENLGLAIATEQSASRVFSNGGQSAIALEFDHPLGDAQLTNLRSQWADNYAGYANHHKPMILESGMKAKSIGMSLADAQFLESRKFQIAEIARWYRVPLHMLNELDKATFSNIEHQSIDFVVHTIRPWLVRIEQTISRDLLTPDERREGLFASHTVEGLLRGDTAARYAAYAVAITNGWMNRNEVRKLENFNPVPGLDDYLVPLNMVGSQESTTKKLSDAENKTLLKESASRDSASFAKWATDYYSRQSQKISDTFGVDASSYALTRIQRISAATDPIEAAFAAIKYTQGDIEALL